MSRLRLIADEDLRPAIVDGLLRLKPSIDFTRVKEAGLTSQPDAVVLEYAAQRGLVVVSHDVNTMTAEAALRMQAGLPMPGLVIVHQWLETGDAIRWLAEVWEATEAEEWFSVIRYAQPTG